MLTETQLALWRSIKALDEDSSIEILNTQSDLNFMINLGVDDGLIPCISFIIQRNMNRLLDCILDRFNVNIHAQDSKYGNTPLHWAAITNNAQAIHMLCHFNADKSALNKSNQKPIDLLPATATEDVKKELAHFPSLQEIIAIQFGNMLEVPEHLKEPYANFLKNYERQTKQKMENQRRENESHQSNRSLVIFKPN